MFDFSLISEISVSATQDHLKKWDLLRKHLGTERKTIAQKIRERIAKLPLTNFITYTVKGEAYPFLEFSIFRTKGHTVEACLKVMIDGTQQTVYTRSRTGFKPYAVHEIIFQLSREFIREIDGEDWKTQIDELAFVVGGAYNTTEYEIIRTYFGAD